MLLGKSHFGLPTATIGLWQEFCLLYHIFFSQSKVIQEGLVKRSCLRAAE